MISILRNIVSFVSKGILLLIGWKLLDTATLNRLNKDKYTVMVFSHTSYADFYIVLLYLFSYPNELNHIRMIVKPDSFKYLGYILTALGGIPATRITDTNGGAVDRIVDTLKQLPKCALLISPKGTILKREWRTGYYYIANKLNANLLVIGLDYEDKCVVISNDISCDNTEETVKSFLRSKLSQIVPLFPNEEVVEIRSHQHDNRNIITKYRLYSLITVATVIGYLLW